VDIVKAILADKAMPPITALGYEYVVVGNGLFIRAENEYLEACVPVATLSTAGARLHGLPDVEPFARLKCARVPSEALYGIYEDALECAPREAMYQLIRTPQAWKIHSPAQIQSVCALEFYAAAGAVIDLHSHGYLGAFFSDVDDADEQDLRFYAVIGNLGDGQPGLCVRVGVYGHHWNVPANTVFDGLEPFRDEVGSFDAEEYVEYVTVPRTPLTGVNRLQSEGVL